MKLELGSARLEHARFVGMAAPPSPRQLHIVGRSLAEFLASFQSSTSCSMRSTAMVEELEGQVEDQPCTKEAAVVVG